jgi:oxygen-independent coproporphyrinogen-3 oxidase
MLNLRELIAKYDVPAPRYTSYPTVPNWSDSPNQSEWFNAIASDFAAHADSSWSLYVHIPFCETLCTFCGCNNTITKSHQVESPYVDKVLKEKKLYFEKLPQFSKAPLKLIHLGGGSPTFLSPESLRKLLIGLHENVVRDAHFEGAMEVDPRRTSKAQLEVLKEFGWNRLSLGVQDFNPEVQKLINRIQPFDLTAQVLGWGRELGFNSINIDLIYGLPAQTPELIDRTVDLTLQLRPDRLALYSFAMVPWIKPQQRLFSDDQVPQGEAKRMLYEKARTRLIDAGYVEIGMDHFALPNDALAQASINGSLHRNFMGYTDQRTDVLLGLGVSSISETSTCFHQNEKVLNLYEKRLEQNGFPTLRGHKLTEEDRRLRKQILSLMCEGSVQLSDNQTEDIREFLSEMLKDELVILKGNILAITSRGKPFLRNACMSLDKRLRTQESQKRVFSQSI